MSKISNDNEMPPIIQIDGGYGNTFTNVKTRGGGVGMRANNTSGLTVRNFDHIGSGPAIELKGVFLSNFHEISGTMIDERQMRELLSAAKNSDKPSFLAKVRGIATNLPIEKIEALWNMAEKAKNLF